MSLYIGSLTIPPLTLEARPLSLDLDIFQRYVDHCEILFPENAAYLVGAALFNQDMRFAPSPGSRATVGVVSRGLWIRDVGPVRWREQLDLGGTPRIVRVRAINEDDTYERDIQVRLEVVDFPNWQPLLRQEWA